ncbi:pitrilysin family protein [Aliikangiella sp. G2MR2-5]|uniref:M16 family metallopeptidase n=1 Tax=Aliikangiella sp. G2MR2-5 TaxID=2788943 RepID=UPI001AEE3520|nr:pitrilysin family protein [Aliikangiella sp. G2MR2-5]
MLGLSKAMRVVAISAAISCTAASMPAMAKKVEAKPVTQVEGITEYQFDNGLRVLLFPDQTKETVTVNITYHVGSKHENYGETGMAHLLEHLVFKGSPKHKDIPKELSSHGARPNGTTWTDRTNYFETFTATEENINWALDMEADRMVNSFIAKEDLDSEMTVVRNEFEMGENSPFMVTLKRAMGAAFSWHNYGKSTIGARADLENVPIDRLKAFYKKYYQPDNATLIVAGKFEQDKMLKKVKKYFGSIPKPDRKLRPLYTVEPAQDGEKSVTVRRVGDVQMFSALYHIPAGSHPDYAAIDVLTQILGDTPSGRLHKSLVEGKLASRAFGFNFQWQEPGVALYASEVDKSFDLDKTANQMLDVLEGLKTNPVTKEEVERAKRNILKNIELSFNSSEGIARNLSEWLGMGDWRLYFLHRDRIEKVTVDDVQRVAETYLQRNNRTAARFIPAEKPERVEIPQVASVADMLEGYKGRAQIAQGENFDPSHDNIDSRTRLSKLSNGTKITLLPKKTRGESVVVNISLDMGNESSLTGMQMVGSAVGNMLMRGNDKYSRQELQDEFDKLKANVRIGGSARGAYASITTTKENLVEVLRLATSVLKKPAFDQKEFEQYLSTTKVDIEQQLQNPQSLAFNEYSRQQNPYPKGHPRYVATFEESLAELNKLKIEDLKKFHQRFYGAGHAQIGVVGDFEPEQIETELEKLYGQWNTEENYKRVARDYFAPQKQNKTFDTPDKENATFVALTRLPVGDNAEEAAALELGNYIFGGGFLNSRLATRLRQQDGLSYSAGSFMQQSAYDERSDLGVYAICAPQNLDKVEIGFKEELIRMLKDGFSEEEIESAKSGLLQGRRVSRSQDRELVGTLVSNLDLDRNMQWGEDYEEKLKNLTAKDVHRAMKKYIKFEDFSIIKAGDLTKLAAANESADASKVKAK